VESGALLELLDLAGSQADSHLDTPNLANLRDALTLGVLTRGDDNLLLALNLVAVEEPRGRALDKVDVIGLNNLLQQLGDPGLCRGLGRRSLGLLLVGTGGEESGGDHKSQEKLIGVVGSQNQVGRSTLDDILGLILLRNDDGVANNRTEAIDLGTELDLDGLAGFELNSGLLLVSGQRGVRSDEARGRDSGGVREALGDLLATVDLGKLLLDELVALLADGDDLLASNAELGDLSKDLLGDLSSSLVLGESIGVVEGVICELS